MLIPIGFFGGGASGSFEHIQTIYGNNSSLSLTFSSIPSTYKHLQIRYVARTDGGSSAGSLLEFRLRFNGDTGNNYYSHGVMGNGSSVFAPDAYQATYYYVNGGYHGSAMDSNSYVAGICDISDYASSTKNKPVKTLIGGTAVQDSRTGLMSGVWNSTAAINSITTFQDGNYPFSSQSRFSLYGLKG